MKLYYALQRKGGAAAIVREGSRHGTGRCLTYQTHRGYLAVQRPFANSDLEEIR
jgi:hypothetical protein